MSSSQDKKPALLSNREKRIIGEAQKYMDELDGGVWEIVGDVMSKITREVQVGGMLHTWTKEMTLAQEFASSRIEYDRAAMSSKRRYEKAREFLLWWHRAQAYGGIVQGSGLRRRYKELVQGIDDRDKRINGLLGDMSLMFKECPRCHFSKGEGTSVAE